MTYRNISFLPLLALAACTSHLELSPITAAPDTKQTAATVPIGVPYALYYDRFQISVTYSIADCDTLTLEVEPTVAEVLAEPDPVHSYVLDPNSLAGPLKTSKVALEYHPDGSVASINASADDRTIETVGALAKSIAGVVKIAAAGGGGTKAAVSCNADTRKAFDAYKTQSGTVKSAKTDIDTAQAEFDIAKAALDKVTGPVPKPVQKRFNNAYLALQGATTRLASAKASLAKLAEPISVKAEFMWPNSGSVFSGKHPTPSELSEALIKWASSSPDVNPGTYALELSLESTQSGALPADWGLPQLSGKELARGLPYRSPARGKLVIRSSFIDPDGSAVPTKVLFEKAYMVRQLGRVYQLPCISRPLTSISCTLAFDTKGQLTKGGSENSKAPLEVAANGFSGAVEAAGPAFEAVRAADEKRRNKPTKEKQDELAALELEAKLAAARKALGPQTPTEQQVRDALILEYESELRLIKARAALAEAQGQVTQ